MTKTITRPTTEEIEQATPCSVPSRNRAYTCLDGREHVAVMDLIFGCGHSRAYCQVSGEGMIALIKEGRIRCGDCFKMVRDYSVIPL